MKKCKECKLEKEVTEYYKYSKGGYLFPYCKPCARARSRTQSKEYYAKNSKKVIKRTNAYTKANREKLRPWFADYAREKRQTDLNYRLAHNLRKRISNYFYDLKKSKSYSKPKSTIPALGCTVQFLIKYLESKWTAKMDWKNYGSGKGKWEIDHIIPLTKFDLTNPDQFMKANHYKNLQPMWSKHNKQKGNRLDYNISKSVPHLSEMKIYSEL